MDIYVVIFTAHENITECNIVQFLIVAFDFLRYWVLIQRYKVQSLLERHLVILAGYSHSPFPQHQVLVDDSIPQYLLVEKLI